MSRLRASSGAVQAQPHRFRLNRAGVLNVWQYDQQVFDFADGRLLLRGANGAGKSKTLEMLLPFVLDGDKSRMTASARHHTSLLWLMLDGLEDSTSRTGYLWVEFARVDAAGERETFTCGVGIRASQSSRVAAAWFFTSPEAVGEGLDLLDPTGPVGREKLRERIAAVGGAAFDSARPYKEHVGRALFGLEPARYDELLRLLYWLRQPQVGEDIEPGRLAEILSVALPELDESALRTVGETFDELAEFGERLGRRERAAQAVRSTSEVYARYSRGVLRRRGEAVLESAAESARRNRAVTATSEQLSAAEGSLAAAEAARDTAEQRIEVAAARLRELESSPQADAQRLLSEKARRGEELRRESVQADDRAARAQGRAHQSVEHAEIEAGRVTEEVAAAAGRAQGVSGAAAQVLPATEGVVGAMALPGALVQPRLEEPGDVPGLVAAVHVAETGARGLGPQVGAALAAVAVVQEALETAERLEGQSRTADERLAEAENAEEQAESSRAAADRAAMQAESALADALSEWQADERAVALDLPPLTRETVERLPRLVRTSTQEETRTRSTSLVAAKVQERETSQLVSTARERRAAVEAETDPQPPPPALTRSPRAAATGLPLWRLVDFDPAVGESARAGLEAALQASGLLDAVVTPEGALLPSDALDTVLPLGEPESNDVSEVLVATPPPGSPVPLEVARAVLRRIGLRVDLEPGSPGGGREVGTCQITPDGQWRLGPLTGRASKPAAQFIGAGARAAERLRQLAEIDAELEELARRLRSSRIEVERAEQAMRDLQTWIEAMPGTQPLLRAWIALDERETLAGRARAAAESARSASAAARARAAQARATLLDLADRHATPADRVGLQARRDALKELRQVLDTHLSALAQLPRRLQDWARLAERADADRRELDRCVRERDAAGLAAAQADAELAAMRERLGADVAALEQALAASRQERREAQGAAEQARVQVTAGSEAIGAARTAADTARARLEEHAPAVAAAVRGLAVAFDAPGLVAAAEPAGQPDPAASPVPTAEDSDVEDPAAAGQTDDSGRRARDLAAGFAPGDKVPAPLLTLARMWARLDPQREADDNTVLRAHAELSAGPAADVEPRVVEEGGALCILGRDDAGEHPLPDLVRRLQARVDADRELLSSRERTLFEEHLLGDVGEALRTRRLEAQELVAAMNGLLEGVSTSQGIRARLRWDLRPDVSPDVRDAAALLTRPLGALLPSERMQLRNSLHRLIETSRAQDPSLGYSEHLQRALDYRRWSAFAVHISRPESQGRWDALTRRTPLSQGEQKVVCYLPLFAAAAAHFTSVAGAAPHAPRLVLLDDAFPKIDARTHPLLFGLLVDLDLDFVVTSERLWGDHDTVPSLAIYEALRSPSERGIAQFEHRWDGARLQAVGS